MNEADITLHTFLCEYCSVIGLKQNSLKESCLEIQLRPAFHNINKTPILSRRTALYAISNIKY